MYLVFSSFCDRVTLDKTTAEQAGSEFVVDIRSQLFVIECKVIRHPLDRSQDSQEIELAARVSESIEGKGVIIRLEFSDRLPSERWLIHEIRTTVLPKLEACGDPEVEFQLYDPRSSAEVDVTAYRWRSGPGHAHTGKLLMGFRFDELARAVDKKKSQFQKRCKGRKEPADYRRFVVALAHAGIMHNRLSDEIQYERGLWAPDDRSESNAQLPGVIVGGKTTPWAVFDDEGPQLWLNPHRESSHALAQAWPYQKWTRSGDGWTQERRCTLWDRFCKCEYVPKQQMP